MTSSHHSQGQGQGCQGQGYCLKKTSPSSPPARTIEMAHARRILPLLHRGTQFAAPLQLRGLATVPPPSQEPFADLDPKTDDTPPRLARPIGLPYPPRAGQNTGVDLRTWAQRRADFVDWDKHLAKRADLLLPPPFLPPPPPESRRN